MVEEAFLKTITLSRPAGGLTEYHRFLRETVFPLVDALAAEGVICGYDFLNHDGIDLRFWIPRAEGSAKLAAALAERGFRGSLTDGTPAESGDARTHLLSVLNRNCEQVRAIVTRAREPRQLEEAIHWLLNQWGLSNDQELEWHLSQACAWLSTLRSLRAPGLPS